METADMLTTFVSRPSPVPLALGQADTRTICIHVRRVSLRTYVFLVLVQARAAYPYADPYFGGIVAAYGAQAMVSSLITLWIYQLSVAP